MVRRALALAAVTLALAPAAASAHARLEATAPARGATVASEPGTVVFRFNEPIEANFGAVRVFDARGASTTADSCARGPTSAGQAPR